MLRVGTALLMTSLAALGVTGARALVGGEPLPVAALAGDGSASVMTDAGALALAGFRPDQCAAGETPPAELLALADWPLDAAGTCVAGTMAGAEVPVEEATIRPIRTLAEVTEATIRDPRTVLGAYGDDPVVTTAAPMEAYGDHGPAAAQNAAADGYGDLVPQRAADGRPLRPSSPEPVGKPLRPVLLAAAPVVDSDRLDTLRGGFELPSGLRVSFGIERAVYVNGVLTSVTAVTLAELGQISGRGISPDGLQPGSTLAVIQNGPNNAFSAAGLASGALATVIQNSLDNQNIRAVTTINATVNSVQMLRSSQMSQSLRDAMVHSLMR